MAISEKNSLKIWQLWHKNPSYELHRSFFFGQEAKIQKFKKIQKKKKKKNCIIKVWGGQFYTGEWGAAKFLHARIFALIKRT
jgi:hypothetical protein